MSRWLAALAAAVSLLASAPPVFPDTIAEVKATAQNWMQVSVEGIITCTEPSECYIESPDRSGGIWVQAPMDGFEVGDPVLAVGTFAVIDGEPAVTNATITPRGTPSIIRPFGMNNRAIGGASKWSPMAIWDFGQRRVPSGGGWAWQREWAPASGANNTGLLVTTWGTVRSVYSSPVTGASWMYVDDGSGVVSDYGDTGVLVYTDAEANIGDFVSVTGVSSTERSFDDPSRLVRVVRTRGAGDVSMLRAREAPVYPFSDEFDCPALDPRWAVIPGPGQVSLDAVPGWLLITTPLTDSSTSSISLVQPESGDWDLDAKIRLERTAYTPSLPTEVAVYVELDIQPRYRYPNYSSAVLGCLGGDPLHRPPVWASTVGRYSSACTGDTCWFRARRRGSSVYGQLSLDGTAYTAEQQVASPPNGFLRIRASFSGLPGAELTYRGLIDYIRFATIAE